MAIAPERSETSDSSERQVVTKVQARQGVTGHHVRYVLGFSLGGIVVVFALIYVFYFA
jgi:hypothetical protein